MQLGLIISFILVGLSTGTPTTTLLTLFPVDGVSSVVSEDFTPYDRDDGISIHYGDHLHDPCDYVPGRKFLMTGGGDSANGFVVINDCQVVTCTKWLTPDGESGGKTVTYNIGKPVTTGGIPTRRFRILVDEKEDGLSNSTCTQVGKFVVGGACVSSLGITETIDCEKERAANPETSLNARFSVSWLNLSRAAWIGVGVGGGILALLLLCCCCCYRRRRRRNKENSDFESNEKAVAVAAGAGGAGFWGWRRRRERQAEPSVAEGTDEEKSHDSEAQSERRDVEIESFHDIELSDSTNDPEWNCCTI